MPTSTQLLVKVKTFTVPASGAFVVTHELRSNDKPVSPKLVIPGNATTVYVDPAQVTDTTVRFVNPEAFPQTVTFRFERGLSNEVDAPTLAPLFWGGNPGGGGGGGPPTGPAGGVLGYPGSTYPNPNGLAALDIGGYSIIPIRVLDTQNYAWVKPDGSTSGPFALVLSGSVDEAGVAGSAATITLQGVTPASPDNASVAISSGIDAVSGESGEIIISTGLSPTTLSGDVIIRTASSTLGTNPVTHRSGEIRIFTGTQSLVPSGDIYMYPGKSNFSTGGSVSITGGDTDNGTAGNVTVCPGYRTGDATYGTLTLGLNQYPVPAVAAGSMLSASAAGVLSELPVGTTGQTLTVVSGFPAWQSGLIGTGIYDNDGVNPADAYIEVLPVYDYGTFFQPPPGVYPAGTGFLGYAMGMSGTNSAANLLSNGTDNPGEGGRVVCRPPTDGVIISPKVAGAVYVQGGYASAAFAGRGGSVVLRGGVSDTAIGGTVEIYSGTGATGDGVIAIDSNGAATTINGASVSIKGNAMPGTVLATGSIIYASAAGVLAERAVGSNGQVLTVVAGVPQWATPGGGAVTTAFRSTTVATSFVAGTDYVIQTTGAASFTVTLPTAVGVSGATYVIKASGTGTITVATTGGQTIDGAGSVTISTQYAAYTFVSDGANWVIV